ncbi:hypothetical protein M758_6G010700 [Ceratodon purpureus]|nr:hypothetical protein M758_6G010700 [Ceratodon purpureus]
MLLLRSLFVTLRVLSMSDHLSPCSHARLHSKLPGSEHRNSNVEILLSEIISAFNAPNTPNDT